NFGVDRDVLLVVLGARAGAAHADDKGQCYGHRGGAAQPIARKPIPHGDPLCPLPGHPDQGLSTLRGLSHSKNGEMSRIPGGDSGEDQGAFAAPGAPPFAPSFPLLGPTTVSARSPITPATIATSARLKTYHLKSKVAVVT